ncbi:hypothetical protein [Pleionea litopenaei]|uniref:Uncharacterized protein n=1 Tax=Pleionea litopenaei TaxID=3070815 RepID=A0AA51RXC9_9GAMM|nr:hypothetical protein [Pleionea sp. HL-JVS1]WMS89289.1 hypothetical protein Q9312_19330 [Pleionea sp. HL-JVS1]WMS89310.1 hypothetical protein Q9312_19220 [Pleionea sp. HL-JVS1]
MVDSEETYKIEIEVTENEYALLVSSVNRLIEANINNPAQDNDIKSLRKVRRELICSGLKARLSINQEQR